MPRGDLTAKGQDVVGIWSTTDRKNAKGDYKQISRLGQPLVNEVVIPYKVKDTFNSLKPTQDAAALPFVQNSELAATLNAVCGTNAPVKNRDDLVQVFLHGVPGHQQPEGQRHAERDAAAQHRRGRPVRPSTGSASSAATATGSRTVAGCRTTSSTSRCRPSAASSRACRTTSATA